MSVRSALTRAATVITGALLAGALAVSPATAVEPFSGPTQIYGSGCAFGNGDGAGSVNGTVRGAVGCNAEDDGPISVFWYQGVKTVRTSPYVGRVIATAWDGGSYLYIVYQQASSLKIGRVTDVGTFASPTVLSTSLAPYTSGDVVAANGKWWVVWSEMVSNQAELFQAKTLLGNQHRTRITNTALQDLEPRLAYTAGRVELAWSRYTPNLAAADLWIAGSTGTAWSSRVFAAAGTHNNMPDITGSAGRFYLAWTRDGVINTATDVTGRWVNRTFGVRGYNPRVATSGGKIFTSYEAVELGGRIYLVERSAAGAWTGAAVTGVNAGNFGVWAANGRATVLYYSINGLSARQQ